MFTGTLFLFIAERKNVAITARISIIMKNLRFYCETLKKISELIAMFPFVVLVKIVVNSLDNDG